jgi:hypothetical protein
VPSKVLLDRLPADLGIGESRTDTRQVTRDSVLLLMEKIERNRIGQVCLEKLAALALESGAVPSSSPCPRRLGHPPREGGSTTR